MSSRADDSELVGAMAAKTHQEIKALRKNLPQRSTSAQRAQTAAAIAKEKDDWWESTKHLMARPNPGSNG